MRSRMASRRSKVGESKPMGTRTVRPSASTTSSAWLCAGAATSTNVSGATGAAALARALLDARRAVDVLDGGAPSFHFHHDSECSLTPVSAAYSAAVRPLSFQRSTRFAHSSLVAFGMPTSGMHLYAEPPASSGTRLAERIRSSATTSSITGWRVGYELLLAPPTEILEESSRSRRLIFPPVVSRVAPSAAREARSVGRPRSKE